MDENKETDPSPDPVPAETDTKPSEGGFDPLEELRAHEREVLKRFAECPYRIDDHLIALLHDEPFYAYISRHIRKVPTVKIPTAGVTVVRREPTMFYNPLFLEALTHAEQRGVIKHEFWHLINEHLTSRNKSLHKLWNIATDAAINCLLVDDKKTDIPAFCIMPGPWAKRDNATPEERANPKLTAQEGSGQAGLPKDDDKSGGDLGEFLKTLPPKQASEIYYALLLMEAQKNGAGGAEEEYWGRGDSFDDHDIWAKGDAANGEGSDEFSRELIKDIVRRACRNADSTNQWGSIPEEMREHIRRIVSNEIDWRKLLRRFAGICQSANWANSMKRINRKYPYVHPGRKRGRSARLAIAVDMSGSVGDNDLELFFAELEGLSKRTTFTVVPFDTAVNDDDVFEWKKGARVRAQRTRCGGTDFDAAINWFNAHAQEYDGLLILTDGYAPKPGHAHKRMGWVITVDGQLQFDPSDAEVVIKLKNPMEQRQAA